MQAEDWLGRRAALSPDKVALIDLPNGGYEVTFAQWNAAANRTAHFLQTALGVRKGDRVAVLAKNSVEYLDIWFALNKLGAVLQNLNWRLTPVELAGLVRDAEPICLVYGHEFKSNIIEMSEAIGEEMPVFVCLCGDCEHSGLSFKQRAAYPSGPPDAPELSLEDPWVICYTGGTTGLPKGAVLTYRSVTANAINTIISWGLSPEDVTLLNSPLFHTGGLNVFTAPLVYLGGTTVVCEEFDLETTFNWLVSGRISVWFGVPTMFVMMQNHARWAEADFSGCRFLISGGAPCPLPVFEKFWARGVDFKTGYGLTEAGPNTFWLPANEVRRKPGAVGYPLFHVDIKLVDNAGQPVAAGAIGELYIRGPHLFSGYWRNKAATAEAIVDGWLRTGDLARHDEEGCYWIMGRIKDMIISGGENIYPAEIETVLHGHPAVVEAAVIGLPDEKWGEVGCAVVVLRSDFTVTGEDLQTFCGQRLARYKIPKQFQFMDQLPKTGANKVDKKMLIQKYG